MNIHVASAEDYIDSLSAPEAERDHGRFDTSRLSSLDASIDPKELVQLCAVDSELFCRTFFASAFRQPSPSFAGAVWSALESEERLVNIQLFRGASKTTRCRAFTLHRVCYGMARTVLFVSKSEADALRSGAWLKRQILYNRPLAQLYGLRQGKKWTDEEFEIQHDIDEHPIWIICLGISGSLRGINRDDFRPDLIILDDIHDRENSATPEQREKIKELVFGALLNSLAPRSEAPHAKLVNLATPLNSEDLTCAALKPGSGWRNVVQPCWTADTIDLPTHLQESVWPERWSSRELRRTKEQYAARNMLSTWMRESELKLTAPELSAFRSEWLRTYSLLPEGMSVFLAIDPVPPPSERAVKKGLEGNDYEVMAVVGVFRGDYYLIDLSANRGHDPGWTRAEFFRLAMRYRPMRVFVESVAYQRTLAWILREEMRKRALYFAIEEVTDQRKKYNRIVDALNGVAAEGHLLVPEDTNGRQNTEAWSMFREQFELFPSVKHDDVLDAVAMAVSGATGRFDGADAGDDLDLERERDTYPRLAYTRSAP